MCALFERDLSNEGQHLDISVQETVAISIAINFASYTYEGRTNLRQGSAPYQPVATMACKDGYVDIQCMTEEQWRRLVGVMGDPEWADWEVFGDVFKRGENWDVLEPLMTEWLMGKGKQDFYREAQAAGVPSAPINTTADLVDSEHLAAREFFVELDHPDTGPLTYPGPFIRLSETPAQTTQRAPLLGEHNQSIYGDRLGHTPEQLEALGREGVI
jgi:crotonobetainyl-CoA:carnitine CoA-transferase CaiB-like acyl-CoA transferase